MSLDQPRIILEQAFPVQLDLQATLLPGNYRLSRIKRPNHQVPRAKHRLGDVEIGSFIDCFAREADEMGTLLPVLRKDWPALFTRDELHSTLRILLFGINDRLPIPTADFHLVSDHALMLEDYFTCLYGMVDVTTTDERKVKAGYGVRLSIGGRTPFWTDTVAEVLQPLSR